MNPLFPALLTLGVAEVAPPVEPPIEPPVEPPVEYNPIGTCPAEDVWGDTYLVDGSDCSVFYKCVNGEPIQMRCPDGLHFNTVLGMCDFPENVDCDRE